MSELRLRKIQLGVDTQNPENNITIETPSISDGTMKIRTGSAQGTGTDILKLAGGQVDGAVLFGAENKYIREPTAPGSSRAYNPTFVIEAPTSDVVVRSSTPNTNSSLFLTENNDNLGAGIRYDGFTNTGALTALYGLPDDEGRAFNKSQYRDVLKWSRDGNTLIFNTGNSEKIRIDSGGALMLTNSPGIDFQSGGTSSTLDDYEEGTWTPTLAFDGGSVDIQYRVRSGKYTKVGNIVTASFDIELTNKGSSTGFASVEGFPFLSFNIATVQIGGGVVTAINDIPDLFSIPIIQTIANSTRCLIRQYDANSGDDINISESSFTNDTRLTSTVTYFTET